MVEMCDLLKIWIQLNIPKIEDGNNFGVSVQVCAFRSFLRGWDSV